MYEIIKKTSHTVYKNPQIQVLLKLKQAANSDFDFLKSENVLFPLYQYMLNQWNKQKKNHDKETNNEKQNSVYSEAIFVGEKNVASTPSNICFDGLIGMYSSSDDDGDIDSKESKHKTEDNDKIDQGKNNELLRPYTDHTITINANTKKRSHYNMKMRSESNKKINLVNAHDISVRIKEMREKRLQRVKLKRLHFASKMKGDKI